MFAAIFSSSSTQAMSVMAIRVSVGEIVDVEAEDAPARAVREASVELEAVRRVVESGRARERKLLDVVARSELESSSAKQIATMDSPIEIAGDADHRVDIRFAAARS